MKIDVYDWPCGYGKTTAVIEKMLTTPARYLLAVTRLDDITERCCDITRIAEKMGGQLPTIEEIRSTDGGGTRGVENVRRAISMAATNYSEREHAIALHQSLEPTASTLESDVSFSFGLTSGIEPNARRADSAKAGFSCDIFRPRAASFSIRSFNFLSTPSSRKYGKDFPVYQKPFLYETG